MPSSIQNSSPKDIKLDIPPELLQNGKALLIEQYSELYVDGRHLSQPSNSIRHAHGLCLLDTQQQDQRSVNTIHQLENVTDDSQFVQMIIELCPQVLDAGKTITIEKSSTKESSSISDLNNGQRPSGNLSDLYDLQDLTTRKTIHIRIPKECIQRGTTIVIEKSNISVLKTDEYEKQQTHHLANNQFTKRDHLQSKNLMEVTIQIPPEILNNGQTITFGKEDSQPVDDTLSYHHQSKSHSDRHQETNEDNSKSLSA